MFSAFTPHISAGGGDPTQNAAGPGRATLHPWEQSLTGVVARQAIRHYVQGVTGGTLSIAGGISTVLKSAGLTISRYSMSGE